MSQKIIRRGERRTVYCETSKRQKTGFESSHPRKGEIYWADFTEEEKENKKDKISQVRKKASQKDRPVVVISNDKQNKYSEEVIVALISSQLDKIYYFELEIALKKKSKILTDQILTIDKSRLGEKIGALNSDEIVKLEKALHVVLSLRYCRHYGFTAESWLLLQALVKKERIAIGQLLEKIVKEYAMRK